MTDLWMQEVKSVPMEVFNQSRNQCGATESEYLQDRSTFQAALGSGRELKALIGFVPPTVLSTKAVMWMAVYADLLPIEARWMRKILPSLAGVLGFTTLYAEVDEASERDTRFIKFLGFTPWKELHDRTIFERVF